MQRRRRLRPALVLRAAGRVPHQQPIQIGRDTSPASNSIHTPAPTGGTVHEPCRRRRTARTAAPSRRRRRAAPRAPSPGGGPIARVLVVGHDAAVLAVVRRVPGLLLVGSAPSWHPRGLLRWQRSSLLKCSLPVMPPALRRSVKRCTCRRRRSSGSTRCDVVGAAELRARAAHVHGLLRLEHSRSRAV